MKVASANYLAHSYLQYEVLPALSIFSSVINSAAVLKVTGNPNCPAPAYSTLGTPTCPASACSAATWNFGGYYCRSRSGAPFETVINNVKKQQAQTNATIYSLMSQANTMLKEAIINITQLTAFGNQFIALTNTMESGISTKQCQWNAPGQICFDQDGNYHWCTCVTSGTECNCQITTHYTGKGPLNTVSYLVGLDHT